MQQQTATSSKPYWLFLPATTACNLRCKQCYLWLTHDSPEDINILDKKRVLEEYANWVPGGVVTYAGGEPFLRADNTIEVSRYAKKLGLQFQTITNATLLSNEILDALINPENCPSYLCISLDAPLAEVHDEIRGKKGTFQLAVNAIEKILTLREKKKCSMQLEVNALLCQKTIPYVKEHLEFLEKLGVDSVIFLPLGPTIGQTENLDVFYEKNAAKKNIPAWKAALNELIQIKEKGNTILRNSTEDLKMIRDQHDEFFQEQICVSGERNLIIERSGDVLLCYSMVSKISSHALGNIKKSSIRTLWESQLAIENRQKMLTCKEPCGIFGCNRKSVYPE